MAKPGKKVTATKAKPSNQNIPSPGVKEIRLVAPFRCHFNLDHSAAAAKQEEFFALIEQIKQQLSTGKDSPLKQQMPRGISIQVNSPNEDKSAPRYVSLESAGSLFHSPGYLDVYFTPEVKQRNHEDFLAAAKHADSVTGAAFSKRITLREDSLFFSIYDHTIGILTLNIELDKKSAKNSWAGLDAWTTHLVSHLLSAFYEKYIHPALDRIVEFAHKHAPGFIKTPAQYVIFYDMHEDRNSSGVNMAGALLWVNRTLICEEGDVIEGWTTKRHEEKDKVELRQASAYLYSGNSIVTHPKGAVAEHIDQLWLGLYIAQYYYAVMDVMSKNIGRFVGLSFVAESNTALRKLSDSMEGVINGVTIFQVKYKDIYQELQGITRMVFQRLEKEWDFKTLFDNVQNKINLCKSNVTRLNQTINQRNQLRVQLVLTMVAGVTLINIALQFSRYAHSLGLEYLTKVEKVPGLLHLGIYLSPNTMIWCGVFLAGCVVTTIMYNRPR